MTRGTQIEGAFLATNSIFLALARSTALNLTIVFWAIRAIPNRISLDAVLHASASISSSDKFSISEFLYENSATAFDSEDGEDWGMTVTANCVILMLLASLAVVLTLGGSGLVMIVCFFVKIINRVN